jgi:hypothetical protein
VLQGGWSKCLTSWLMCMKMVADGALMPSWFDLKEIPVTAVSPLAFFAFSLTPLELFNLLLIHKFHMTATGIT